MRTVEVRCDKCREVVDVDASQLEATSGPLRARLDARAVDLCGACSRAFAAWLDAPPAGESSDRG